MTGFEHDYSIISELDFISDFLYDYWCYPVRFIKVFNMVNEIYRRWQTWTYWKEDEDFWGVTKSEGVPADSISSINKTDLPKYIEDYATTVESNLKMAEMMRDAIPLPCSCTRLLKEQLNILRCWIENACQGMHKHYTYSFHGDALVDIFYRLQEVSICIVELLKNVKNVADFCKQLISVLTVKPIISVADCFNRFLDHILGPIFRNVVDSISKFDVLMQANLKYYAASVMYDVISIIIALLLFICQSALGSATDMKQLMIFATVIHLIISGDVESNPGPQYDPKKLLRKKPKISDFQRIFIQSGAACHWPIFARALDIDMNDPIYCSQSAKVMIGTVFERWRDRHQDFTWERIIEACEGYDEFGEVRRTIDKFLSSDKAHEKYGDEPDFESEESRRSENDHSNNTDNGPVININVHVHVPIPTSILIFSIVLLLIFIILCGFIIYRLTNDNC